MSHVPRVSVVMPVYNAERYLHAAIDSVLAQTFTDFEFLILDDGSTDGSLKIARSYQDIRIRVIATVHCGLEAIRNKGLAESRSNYVAWMDADDISEPERLMKQVLYLETHHNTVAVGTWARLIDKDSRATGTTLMPPTNGRQLLITLCAENPFINGSSMMRKDVALMVGGYRKGTAPAEDYDLWFRLGEVGELANLAEPLYHLRVHSTSISARTGNAVVKDVVSRIQRNALQRYLHRFDQLDHTTSQGSCASQEAVRLSDWAQRYLWYPRLCIGDYLLVRAVISQPRDACAWSLIRRRFMSRATARAVVRIVCDAMDYIVVTTVQRKGALLRTKDHG